MKDELFNDLLQSVVEAGAVHSGKPAGERVSVYRGKILIAVRENGEVVWSLHQAAEELRGANSGSSNAKHIREVLGQTQEGFAELLGVSVRTLQNWEQGRREPQGPAERLLRLASRHPLELLDSIQGP